MCASDQRTDWKSGVTWEHLNPHEYTHTHRHTHTPPWCLQKPSGQTGDAVSQHIHYGDEEGRRKRKASYQLNIISSPFSPIVSLSFSPPAVMLIPRTFSSTISSLRPLLLFSFSLYCPFSHPDTIFHLSGLLIISCKIYIVLTQMLLMIEQWLLCVCVRG